MDCVTPAAWTGLRAAGWSPSCSAHAGSALGADAVPPRIRRGHRVRLSARHARGSDPHSSAICSRARRCPSGRRSGCSSRPASTFARTPTIRSRTAGELDFWPTGEPHGRACRDRRLAPPLTRGPFTLELGKQFVRWGKTDIVVPTDRFAPRDYLTVVDCAVPRRSRRCEARPVPAVHTIELVWAPRLHAQPSSPCSASAGRCSLLARRQPCRSSKRRRRFPGEGRLASAGARFGIARILGVVLRRLQSPSRHPASTPSTRPSETIEFSRVYPPIRSYGADAAVPLAAGSRSRPRPHTSRRRRTDHGRIRALRRAVERQSGEWLFVGGYAGEVVTTRRSPRRVRTRPWVEPRVSRPRGLHDRRQPLRGVRRSGSTERRRRLR